MISNDRREGSSFCDKVLSSENQEDITHSDSSSRCATARKASVALPLHKKGVRLALSSDALFRGVGAVGGFITRSFSG